ncbi:PKD domain-containing protein [candidate division WWE3 bacterium]|uniref:PKD domain-containing protein n=1 Tax=candidate division WWE3 bacterium TaxID=2053526 RepID=A0A955RSG2_UNCKA|nr:PKD domain-containing protein [candidate division WWE3 bacterium]
MKKLLFLAIFLTTLTVVPQRVSAHSIGQPAFFRMNGEFVDFYPVPITSADFRVPQSISKEMYAPNEIIEFDIVTALLQAAQSDIDQTVFKWDFGDGTTGSGLKNTHSYENPGSYVLTIMAQYQDLPDQLLESTMINVLPSADYKLPQAKVYVNGVTTEDPANTPLRLDLRNKLEFDASQSSAATKIVQYMWDFGDEQTGSGLSVKHAYDLQQPLYFAALRVVDENGMIGDTYVEIIHETSPELITQGTSQSDQNIQSFFDHLAQQLSDLSRDWSISAIRPVASLPIFLLSILFVFLAGGLHAVTPGHGKSIMAAYLVGKNKSGLADVLTIALSITITHTLMIYVLAFVFLVISRTRSAYSLIPIFEKLSAVLVLLIAIGLVSGGVKKLKHRYDHEHGHPHEHYHDHEHGHNHHHHHEQASSRRGLILAGISGGLVPCVDALALLMLAVGSGQTLLGIFFVFIFSIGLASTITLIGLIAIMGKNRFDLEKRFGKVAEIYAPIISGVVIFLIALKLLF